VDTEGRASVLSRPAAGDSAHLVEEDALALVLAVPEHTVGRVADRALVAGHTAAGEVVAGPRVGEVLAGRAVAAGLVGAGYEPEVLAELAGVLFRALAVEGARQVNAYPVVLAGPRVHALVHVLLAPAGRHPRR
jgi:hypothetical protein